MKTGRKMAKSFYSTPELAELLGVFHSTVRRWIERDQVKGFRVGRNYKIPAAEVKRMLNRLGLPIPEAMEPTPLKQNDQTPLHPSQGNGAVSFLKKLLVVEEIDEPAVIFRRDVILGANKRFSDFVGCEQLDLIGVELNYVLEGLLDANGGRHQPSAMGSSQMDSPELSAYVKSSRGDHKACMITVDEVAGLQEVFLAVVKKEM